MTIQEYSLLMVKDSAPKSKRTERLLNRDSMQSPDEVYKAIRPFFVNLDREKFAVVALNTRNKITAFHTVSIGNLDSSIVHPREVFKFAILNTAASVIFVHNHPSGNLEPSSEDINLTRRLKECGELLGIPVLDHLIVSNDGFLSLKNRNLF